MMMTSRLSMLLPSSNVFKELCTRHGLPPCRSLSSQLPPVLPRGLRPRRPVHPRRHELQTADRLVLTMATASAYDRVSLLTLLQKHVITQGLMERLVLPEEISGSCLALGNANSDLFFFLDEGAVVFWNVEEDVKNVVLSLCLNQAQIEPLDEHVVSQETESIVYVHEDENESKSGKKNSNDDDNGKETSKSRLKNNTIVLGSSGSLLLEKYAFSHALAASVSLGALEALLDRVIESLQPISDDLKRGSRIQLSREDVLRRLGEIFALRHAVNLSSDLLNTPDFYWDRETLEQLYIEMRAHLSVSKRTKTTNEKLTYCTELLELVKDHLSDKHHVRLEWFIIVLILIEVIFEIIHFIPKH